VDWYVPRRARSVPSELRRDDVGLIRSIKSIELREEIYCLAHSATSGADTPLPPHTTTTTGPAPMSRLTAAHVALSYTAASAAPHAGSTSSRCSSAA
jgi:hypothetical protein